MGICTDLAVARAAVSEMLGKGGKTISVPWENPRTGARGTITPLASAYTQNGVTCDDFLASDVRDGSTSWLRAITIMNARTRSEASNRTSLLRRSLLRPPPT